MAERKIRRKTQHQLKDLESHSPMCLIVNRDMTISFTACILDRVSAYVLLKVDKQIERLIDLVCDIDT